METPLTIFKPVVWDNDFCNREEVPAEKATTKYNQIHLVAYLENLISEVNNQDSEKDFKSKTLISEDSISEAILLVNALLRSILQSLFLTSIMTLHMLILKKNYKRNSF